MRTILTVAFFVFTFLVSACMNGASDFGKVPLGEARTLARGSQSGIRVPRDIVARTPEEWLAVWRDHARNVVPEPPLPEVDWADDMVIGVVLGDRPSAGYSVSIARIEDLGSTVKVWTVEVQPLPGAMQAMVVTSPFHFVEVRRRDVPVEFECQ